MFDNDYKNYMARMLFPVPLIHPIQLHQKACNEMACWQRLSQYWSSIYNYMLTSQPKLHKGGLMLLNLNHYSNLLIQFQVPSIKSIMFHFARQNNLIHYITLHYSHLADALIQSDVH